MADKTKLRRFWRVPFHAVAVLRDAAGADHTGHLHDISLKGALFEPDGQWQARVDDHYRLSLELSADVSICMEVTSMHVDQHCVGLRCNEIDLDSITALRRLVSLNAGDETQLERDLSALVRG